MKKLLLSLLLVLPLCSFAQKGMRGIGVGVELGSGIVDDGEINGSSFGALFKYEYNLTDRLRFSTNVSIMKVHGFSFCDFSVEENPYTPNRPPSLNTIYEVTESYGEGSNTAYTLGLDFHYFLNKVRPFRPYLLLGGSFGVSSQTMDNGPSGGFKAGLGFNWRLTHNCTFQLELPFRSMYMGEDYVDYSEGYYYYEGNELSGSTYYEYHKGERTDYPNYYNYLRGHKLFDYWAFTPSISIVYTF